MSETLNFESSMAELAEIVKQLEKGELPLEDCLKQYEKGIKLANVCQQVLSEAQQRVEVLQPNAGTNEFGDV